MGIVHKQLCIRYKTINSTFKVLKTSHFIHYFAQIPAETSIACFQVANVVRESG